MSLSLNIGPLADLCHVFFFFCLLFFKPCWYHVFYNIEKKNQSTKVTLSLYPSLSVKDFYIPLFFNNSYPNLYEYAQSVSYFFLFQSLFFFRLPDLSFT